MTASRAGTASCPFCDGVHTELSSAFGSHASVSTWWCRDCRSPFEVFKWGNHPDERDDSPALATGTPSGEPDDDDE